MSDEVPNRILMNKYQAYGARLPKLKKYVAPTPVRVWVPMHEQRRTYSGGVVAISSYGRERQLQNQVHIGNLDVAEYRYWIGVRAPLSLGASCRLCKWPTWNQLQRKEHKMFGCLATLDDLYKILWADEVCLLCGKKSKMTRWGVRFCEPQSACLERFPFSYESQRILALEFMAQFGKQEYYKQVKEQVLFAPRRLVIPDTSTTRLLT